MKSIADLNASFEVATKSRELFEVARFEAIARGKRSDALLFAKQAGASSRTLAVLQERATPATSQPGSGTWGSELSAPLSAAFISSLQNLGVFDSMLPFAKNLPTKTRASIVIAGASGHAAAEGSLKTISEIALANATLAERDKIIAAAVCSSELLKLGGPSALKFLFDELRLAVAAQTDSEFISILSDGLVPIPSVNDVLGDIAQLAYAIPGGNGSKYFVIVSPLNAKKAAFARSSEANQLFTGLTPTGGVLSGTSIMVSDELDDSTIIGFDSSQILAAPGVIDVGGSGEALIDLGGSIRVDLWGGNRVALKAERIGWAAEKVRTEAAAIITDAAWPA